MPMTQPQVSSEPVPSSQSLAALLVRRVALTPNSLAFRFPRGAEWIDMTWALVGERVRAIASGLASLGLTIEDRAAILCSTRVEWILADLGAVASGAAVTTIYPASTPDECAYILNDAGCKFVFVEDAQQLAKLMAQRASLSTLEKVILIEGEAPEGDWVLTLSELERRGREFAAKEPKVFDRTVEAIKPHHLATIIYTSGTTGTPKGVELTHSAWIFEAEAIASLQLFRQDDTSYLWLPMAHVFGKVLLSAQIQVGLCSMVDGRLDKLMENIAFLKPTLVAAVPRIFEKMRNKILDQAKAGGKLKYTIFRWAIRKGEEFAARTRAGQAIPPVLSAMHSLADRLVLRKIREAFGGRIRFFTSGSAPLSREVAEFFHAAGMLIMEGYGLTETGAASFVNRPDTFRFGTVGKPLPGVEFRFAADREIQIKCPGVMRGYRNKPEATAETISDGWLSTGDIGETDEDGFLRITDRKKDLIKTSGGKYVAPQALEGKLRLECPLLGHVVVHGDGRHFCSALFTVDPVSLKNWAKNESVQPPADGNWSKLPALRKFVDDAVGRVNAVLPSYSTIKAFEILADDFTVATGELTTSLKVRRRFVEDKYRHVLDKFYEGSIRTL